MGDIQENAIENALAEVQFDDNGLPILDGNRKRVDNDNHNTSIPLKRTDDAYFIVPEQVQPKVEISDEQIFKNIIKRTKKQPITITVKHTLVTVDPTVLTVINDSIQCETEDDKLELLFEEIYDQQEVKRLIFEEFKKVYKKQD